MRKALFFILIVICSTAVFPHITRAQDNNFMVHFIYFRASDTPARPNVDAEIDTLVKKAQLFFADEMERHGFGRKTFRFETDASGNTVVPHVVGKFKFAYYKDEYQSKTWARWTQDAYEQNINTPEKGVRVFMLESNGESVLLNTCGTGGQYSATIACWNWLILTHELGHAFGLGHDHRDDRYIMSYGAANKKQLSKCNAEWLNVSHAFNPDQPFVNFKATNQQIELLSPTLVALPDTIRLRFEVADPDGLHQVQFLRPEKRSLIGGSAVFTGGLTDCKQLNGEPHSTVEFVTTLLSPKAKRVGIKIIDKHGNFVMGFRGSYQSQFIPIDITPLLPPSEIVLIPEGKLASAMREALDLTPTDAFTTHTMLDLEFLSVPSAQLTDLTGIEHAHALRQLILSDNTISDVSPLLGLNLTHLWLRGNPLSYASINAHIPAIQAKGTEVVFDNIAHPALMKISGDAQEGPVGAIISPFVVEVLDEDGQPMPGVPITFVIFKGEGMLAPTTATTDANGRAQTTLALSWTPGTYSVRVVAGGIGSVHFTATATVLPDRIAADVNGDGAVDVEDLMLVAASFGKASVFDVMPKTDVNGDGEVNDEDVQLVLAELEAVPAAPALNTQWTVSSLQRWIAEAKRHNRTDPTFQRGIAVLEHWLATLLPKETVLLPNYPNPFNPETWVPYQLSKPADVILHIYSVEGALIRTLTLGHQPPGMYRSKSRAAYWNGRNELGEPVASGVYFYTLSAGDFTDTGKMLIQK